MAPVLTRPYVTNWARLHAPQTATTVRQQQGETLLTRPFVDTRSSGGLIFIRSNLDAALAVAAELQALRSSGGDRGGPLRGPGPWWPSRGSSA